MRILVTHNADGEIQSMLIPPAELAGEVHLVPEPGFFVTEVDTAEVDAKRLAATEGDPDGRARLLAEFSASLLQSRIDMKNKRLMKKIR